MGKRPRRHSMDGMMIHVPDVEPSGASSSKTHIVSTNFAMRSNGGMGYRSQRVTIEDITDGERTLPHAASFESAEIGYLDTVPLLEDNFDDAVDPSYTEYLDDSQVNQARKPYKGDYAMHEWRHDREQFLAEFLRMEGLGSDRKTCHLCNNVDGHVFRCTDCDGRLLYCTECLLRTHAHNGLHNIEIWKDEGYFAKSSLQSLGFRFQLGHVHGDICYFPIRSSHQIFTILDTNGIHEVTVDFCGCGTPPPHFVQLLRFGWYPSTVGFPRSGATLRLLKKFQILSFESKASAFEYYQTLTRLTDNTGTFALPVRYRAFMRMVRQYRHIKMLKRAGRGHDRSGVTGTLPRQCAVVCPACPRPGINLADDWVNAPPEKRFLYTLFLGIDANFRLKRKMISNNASDPSLSSGWAYFVDENEYKDFLDQFGKLVIQEPSTCSNHNAVNREKGKDGLAASGVSAIDCVRHDMKRPTSVGDLQKGERYVNMDYVFCSSVANEALVEVVISYDIACQWGINIWNRLKIYPSWMHVNHDGATSYRFLVPKFHLPAHIQKCQTKFSFNFNANVGRTDGEGIERGWAHINPVASSTREMGPGARHDTLDDHFGDYNWRKICILAALLLRRLKNAVPEMVDHRNRHSILTASMPSANIEQWSKELTAWECDTSLPNPFETRTKTLSQQAVRGRLADEERTGGPTAFVMYEDISASHLISMGIDFEDNQRQLLLAISALSIHATDLQKTKLKIRAGTLRRKIDTWIQIQHMYIPSLIMVRSQVQNSMESSTETPAHAIPLRLPSSLARSVPCDPRLLSIEWELRRAQAWDALDDLREALRLRSHILIDKKLWKRGQISNTRSNDRISHANIKVDATAERYRVARKALLLLAPRLDLPVVDWGTSFPELKPGDVRGLPAEEDDSEIARKKMRRVPGERERTHASEGHNRLSWIWVHVSAGEQVQNDTILHDALRIEWCKSKARQDRWREEVELLQEEMRRVKATFRHQSATWCERSTDMATWTLPGVSGDELFDDGRRAFAREQQHQFDQMHDFCQAQWANADEFVRLEGAISLTPAVAIDEDDVDFP